MPQTINLNQETLLFINVVNVLTYAWEILVNKVLFATHNALEETIRFLHFDFTIFFRCADFFFFNRPFQFV